MGILTRSAVSLWVMIGFFWSIEVNAKERLWQPSWFNEMNVKNSTINNISTNNFYRSERRPAETAHTKSATTSWRSEFDSIAPIRKSENEKRFQPPQSIVTGESLSTTFKNNPLYAPSEIMLFQVGPK